MRGVFVLQLWKSAAGVKGSLEEVDTGKAGVFHSEDELIRRLRQLWTEVGGERIRKEEVE